MSNYTKTTNFAAKDSLPSGNANKIVKGTEIDTEFDNIATASATKADIAGPTFTGTVTIPTVDLNGGAIDGTTVGASTAAAITGTTIVANTSINIAGDGATVTGIKDEDDMSSNSATKLATQQSIKAYVDSQVTAQDLDFQADSGGALSIDLDSETLTFTGGTGVDTSGSGNAVTFAIDSTVATLTGTQTLTNKTLTSPTLNTPTIGTSFTIGSATITEAELEILDGATVTTAELNILDGVTATTAEINYVDGVTSNVQTQLDAKAPIASPTFTGTVTVPGLTTSANILFGDNDKAIFGAGSDLQIFHNGTESFIRDVGTGGLKIDSNGPDLTLRVNATESAIVANSNGSVDLYYDNALKLATTSTGIDVTGTVTADGLTVDGASAGTVTAATFTNTTSADGTRVQVVLQSVSSACNVNLVSERVGANFGADFIVETSDTVDGTDRQRLRIAETGDISFYEDTGTTPKMMWDSSAESLGIGTTAPERTLHVESASVQIGALISNTSTVAARLSLMDANTTNSARVGIGATGDNLGLYAGGAERATIDSSGNVGIGVTPESWNTYKTLQIGNGAIANYIPTHDMRMVSNAYYNSGWKYAESDGACLYLQDGDNSAHTWSVAASGTADAALTWSEAMRITSAGNVMVGKTSSGTTVDGVELIPQGAIYAVRTSNVTGVFNRKSTDGHLLHFRKNNSTVGSISVTGSATTYNTSSDQRLKENIADADDAGSKVDSIQVRKFDWIADGSHQDYGMIAQELQSVAPEAVSTPEDPEEMMGVDYSKLVPMLVKEIQSLRARVAQLENN